MEPIQVVYLQMDLHNHEASQRKAMHKWVTTTYSKGNIHFNDWAFIMLLIITFRRTDMLAL